MMDIPKVMLKIESGRKFGRDLLRGIAKYSKYHRPWIFHIEPPFYKKTTHKIDNLSLVKKWGISGIITRDIVLDENILAMGIPVVSMYYSENVVEGVPYIKPNFSAISEMAANYFFERGFHHLAFCGFDDMPWSRKYEESYKKKINKNGYDTYIYRQGKTKAERLWENERPRLCEWLKSLPKPIGFLACNDDRARHATEACRLAGLPVPEEIAILGIDDDEVVCDLCNPSLSSIALNGERVGYEAAEHLDKMMLGEKRSRQEIIVQPVNVITRQSTDVMAIEDSDVAAAINFIRKNIDRIVYVNDVVESVPLSRRVLERRFQKFLGRTINQEINRARIEIISSMLRETNLTISQIAMKLGYPDFKHIAESFKREKGMAPLAYRKQFGLL